MENNTPVEKEPTTIEELLNSKWGKAAEKKEALKQILDTLPELLQMLGKHEGKLAKLARDAAFIFEVLRKHLSGEQTLTIRDYIIIVAALLYLISPLDAIPDTIPVLGWLDDMGVITLAAGYIIKRFAAAESGNAGGETNA